MDKFDGLRPTGPGIKVALHPDTQIAKEESLQEPGRPALPCSPVRHQHLHLRHPSHARAPGPFRARWSLIPVPLSPPAGDRPSAASRAVVCVCVRSAPLAVCVRGRPPSARASVPVCRDHPGTRGQGTRRVGEPASARRDVQPARVLFESRVQPSRDQTGIHIHDEGLVHAFRAASIAVPSSCAPRNRQPIDLPRQLLNLAARAQALALVTAARSRDPLQTRTYIPLTGIINIIIIIACVR